MYIKLLSIIIALAHLTASPCLSYALRPTASALLEGPSSKAKTEDIGPLDGLTILRFTHDYEKGQGVGEHLRHLNNVLLQRNKLTIIQMYMTDDEDNSNITTEHIGKGTLIAVPVFSQGAKDKGRVYEAVKALFGRLRIKDFVRDRILNSGLSVVLERLSLVKKFYDTSLNTEAVRKKAAEILNQKGLFRQYEVDLALIHFLFSADCLVLAEEVRKTEKTQKRTIPVLMQHHSSNSSFLRPIFKKCVSLADGIATVSGTEVPEYVRSKRKNLSNAIDADFFSPDKAKPLDLQSEGRVIFLPARVWPVKGHLDLIRIASRILKNTTLPYVKIIFAGSIRTAAFKEKIQRLAEKEGILDDIIFTGPLSQDEMRDYYAISDVVVLPSHSEGLPRVLLEAQAMEKPVVAYNIDGVSEAVVDGLTGYRVKKGDIGEFADKLSELLLDEDKRISMGRAGRDFVKRNFKLLDLVKRHEDFYLSVLEKEKTAAGVFNPAEETVSKSPNSRVMAPLAKAIAEKNSGTVAVKRLDSAESTSPISSLAAFEAIASAA